jgi:hypothetical protein
MRKEDSTVTQAEKKILEIGLTPLPVKQIGAERVAGFVQGMIREREKSQRHAFVLVPSTPWGIGLSLATCALLLAGLFGIQTGHLRYGWFESNVAISNIGTGLSHNSVNDNAKIDQAVMMLDSTKARLSFIHETYRDSSAESTQRQVTALLAAIDSCRNILYGSK